MDDEEVLEQMVLDFSAPTPGAARKHDPATSKAAAAAIDTRGQRLAVLRALAVIGEGTGQEISDASGLVYPSAWRRIPELRRQYLVEPTGTTRPGDSGRQQMVYRLTSAGRAATAT